MLFLLFANVQADDTQRINVRMNNISLRDFFSYIEKNYSYTFMYDNTDINDKQLISVNERNLPIEKVLASVLKDKGIRFEVQAFQIILSKANTIVSTENRQQARKNITGRILDEKGEPVIGANIVEKGTTNGTVTDVEGNFTLNVEENAAIHVSYIGYLPQDITSAGKNSLHVVLIEDLTTLDEIVVVGYGTMRKRDLTGSVSSIKSEDIQRSPVTSLDQAIQGKAAGVQVSQASSAPGGRVLIRVRGGNSLSSSNEPLYVVDGFPVSAGGSAGGNGTAQNPLATLNTADIASIEILKDASATAIYGARGANGVVLITTKRGEIGKPQVTLDVYHGVQTLAKKLDLMNAREYATLVNEARANDGQSPVFPNPNNLHYFPDISALGEGVDYQDEVFHDAPVQNYNIGVAGGNEGIRYSVGGGYFGQDGIIRNSDFNRASFRSNLDIKITPALTVTTNITASHSWANGMPSEGDGGGGTGGVVHGAIVMPASVPIFDADGNYTMTNPTPGSTPSNNPVATVNHYKDEQAIDRFLGSVDASWAIMKDLTLKVTFGTDLSTANRAFYWPKETHRGSSKNGEAYQRYRKDASYLNENILTYNKQLGKHAINAVGGYTWQVFHYKYFEASSTNYSSDLYFANNLGAGTTYGQPGSSKSQSQLASYLGRVNYIYNDRYLFTLTARADGSSKFGTNNKWSFFPSFALAWRASEEEFLKSVDWLSNLKIRMSYGKTGNQNIDNYKSLAMLGTMNYPLGGTLNSGVGPNNIPNPDLKWETTATTDAGLDIGLFNNRVSLVVDYYYKKTTDLLWNISTPSSVGFSSIFKNIGSLENKGVEVSLGADVFTGEFKWNTQMNWSRNRNKVLEIPGYTPNTQGQLSGHLKVNGSWLEPGLPVGVWNLLKYDGVFQDQAQLTAGPRSTANKDQLGDARFIDKSGDGKINYTDDRMIVGDPNPDFIYGWTNNFSFKGFDFSVYLQGSHGNDIINIQRAETNISGPWGNQRREILNRWTPSNTNTNIPRARVTVDPLLLQSDWLIEDGSYMRVKTMTLGYTFMNFRFINSLRLYVTGQNLFTITDYSGFDPEVNSQGNSNLQLGVDYNAYPSARAVLFGLNVSF
ncbi:MAG: SusC/RagA family TonB-linked outer membrane protein [Bacteroidetes bacterium GWD2_45_23]|nr:MAG: SusC/RagA family TonB-linked outer membrane protein [Bacteroidetes bacterium GWC2_46_850]OFX65855.1 MAG: SusC/RagA family TonB-linked outer membrane protein [Bacteroidetes bacterium GWC1_47_7]OFX83935.1 MAG: SusC/RagA family TonB-linked outer membrane protein [Bacteroidetes bacterium GWD2_45_23]